MDNNLAYQTDTRQYNLKVAATALNPKSLRSHCIFTIILLKYYTENLPDTVKVSTYVFFSSFLFYIDLYILYLCLFLIKYQNFLLHICFI